MKKTWIVNSTVIQSDTAQKPAMRQYAVGFQGIGRGMRAGRSDQSYLESGTNVQLVIAAVSVGGREKRLLTFKVVGNNGAQQSGWDSSLDNPNCLNAGRYSNAGQRKVSFVGDKFSIPKPQRRWHALNIDDSSHNHARATNGDFKLVA